MNNFADKKILFVINNLTFGGAEKLVVDQINFLNEDGYDVSLLTFLPNVKGNFMNRLEIPEDKIFFVQSKFNLQSIFQVRQFLKKHSFDFIFSNLFFSNTLVRSASIFLLKKPKIIIYEHNAYTSEKKKKHLAIDWLLSFGTLKIIAVSNEVKAYLIKNYINPKKIEVVRNGINFPNIDTSKRQAKREELGVTENEILFVAVGNVEYQKGHIFLLEAAKILSKNNDNFTFVICGRTTNTEIVNELKTKLSEYKLENNFKFLGNRADVLEIVDCADVFVMPSRWEGLSIALLEAMSLKKPIVVSNIQSMTNVLTDTVDSLIFKTGDSEELAQKLQMLASQKDLRVRLGEAARRTVDQYSIENNLKQLFATVLFSLDEKKKTFNLVDQTSGKWMDRAKVAVGLLSFVQLNKSYPWTIGDFGCGNKKVLEILQQEKDLNFKYKGYDILPQSEDIEKINFSKEFPDSAFDVVFIMGMLEYIEDLDFLFKNLSQKCKYVILSSIISDANKYTKNNAIKNGWINYLSTDQLIKIIESNNFQIVNSNVRDAGVTFLAVIKNKNLVK